MKLWEISKLMNEDKLFKVSDEQSVDMETGEVFDKEYLDNLPMEREEKSKNVGLVVKGYEANINEIDAELKRLTALKRHYNSRIQSLKSYVLAYGVPVNDVAVQIKFSKGRESVQVEDGVDIPNDFKTWKWTPNKTAIGKALKAGEEIPGCSLVRKPSVTIK